MMTSWQCVSPAAPSGPPAQQGPLQVNVPCYLLRGQGKDEHYEYEVKLAALDIPPKKLFGNRDERMINERRGHLEVIKPVLKYPCGCHTYI
ncbi:kinesin-like protein KIF16B [Gadus morhua]|uniref:kinesin-like protein KIF16B n=1 Tax=Gadus morhua TaxID=8049 RepID=UPI0011B7ABA3|nr:kinesin-like protein KIF16B [Gadus morhua]